MYQSCPCRATASKWPEILAVNGGPDVRWAPVWDRIDEDFDEHLEEIRTFLRCPTVSASDDDMLATSPWAAASTPAVRCCARERQAPKNHSAWERFLLSRSLYPAIEQPATWPQPQASELPDPHGTTGRFPQP